MYDNIQCYSIIYFGLDRGAEDIGLIWVEDNSSDDSRDLSKCLI